jgi:hypothetical protein
LTLAQDFWKKLKKHLLDRIKATHADLDAREGDPAAELEQLYFKKECMYKHNIMKINYTTYDVQRAQDTINPNTDHRDIMLLSAEDSDSSHHQFLYARVLGIYHVNVIYVGDGRSDYGAKRMEFLWVRWFVCMRDEPVQQSWSKRRLDSIRLVPIHHENAVGFVDPANVLRSAHLIPRFACGKRNPDDKGISECGQDSKDWNEYYAAR